MCGAQWDSSHFLFRLIFFPNKIHYLMSYSSLYGCVAKGSYFSVHHKFSTFEIKYVKKRGKMFFFLTVYYSPLLCSKSAADAANLSIFTLRHVLCGLRCATSEVSDLVTTELAPLHQSIDLYM